MIAGIHSMVDLQQAVIEPVELPVKGGNAIVAGVLRTDKIHATISGNKWFKLKYALEEVLKQGKKTVLTFGGAHSNHLVATAAACSALNLKSVGIVRGEMPSVLSPSLVDCRNAGMELLFESREIYRSKQQLYAKYSDRFPDAYLIPEGGCSALGVKGSADILRLADVQQYTHICCAVGTGTMMAGLVADSEPHQQVIGFAAAKIPAEGDPVPAFISSSTGKHNFRMIYDFHFGGFAKHPPGLIAFINGFYQAVGIETDIVYTGKLLFGVHSLANSNYFPAGSRVLVIHSGGLQGNRSLPKNTLLF